jgi:predicted nucleotidyltransferase
MDIVNKSPRGHETQSTLTPLSSILKEERHKSGMTQMQLAKKLGIGLASIRKIEQGNDAISMALVNKLLHYFGLEMSPTKLISSPHKELNGVIESDEVKKRLQALFPIFKTKFKIKKLGLFGSHAYGGQDSNSDIDILVESDDNLNFKDLGSMQVILEHVFEGKKIDLLQRKNVKPEFWPSIEEDLIYVKE